mmetsp:Transcript_13732/g.43426  ORF Transcript_13732/g.43426 Transcript_13732/m.43426 type:complete len:396 (+) Transcript_13732:83-1270(+)
MPLGWWASPEVAPVMAVLAFNSVGPLLREGAKGSDGAFHFNTSSIPWVEEVGKFVFTSACLLGGWASAPKYGVNGAIAALCLPFRTGDFSRVWASLNFAIPSLLFALQNFLYWKSLRYMGRAAFTILRLFMSSPWEVAGQAPWLTHGARAHPALVDPGTYVVLNNVKLLITGALEHTVLGIRLSRRQGVSLLVLAVGIALSQYSQPGKLLSMPWQGYALSVGNSATAALGNVAVKHLYSTTPGTFMEQNWKVCSSSSTSSAQHVPLPLPVSTSSLCAPNSPQLYLYGCIFRSILIVQTMGEFGLFIGYTPYLSMVIAFSCGAHLLTALVVKVHSAVAKGYVVSVSMILAVLLSWAVFGKQPPPLYGLAVPIIAWAVFAYTVPAKEQPAGFNMSIQ